MESEILARLAPLHPTALTRAETRALRTSWRRVFARSTFALTGQWCREGFDWHVFSHHDVPALHGAAALREYAAQTDPEIFVLSDGPEGRGFAFRCTLAGRQAPTFDGADVLVVDVDLTWTMAFTHETGLYGPYFARAEEAAEAEARILEGTSRGRRRR